MPIYSYQCLTHGEFVQLKTVSRRNEAAYCPECNTLSERGITKPNLSIMTETNRKAWQRNEKSRHEPKRVTRKHSCTHNHSHHATQAPLEAAQKNTRPWMLGH
ncbi:MAG: zinc ribbon domain-containing protein [Gammaproteobacteria bacterium]